MENKADNKMDNTIQNALVKAEKPKKDKVTELVIQYEKSIEKSLPKGIDIVKFQRDIMTALTTVPGLKECTPASVIMAFMATAQLGLTPNSPQLGQAWILPFNQKTKDGTWIKQAQFQFGYKGLLELAYRDKRVQLCFARTVYKNDIIDIDYGNQTVKHQPCLNGETGEVIGYYAVIRLVGGVQHIEYMSKKMVEQHRAKFVKEKNGENFAWRDNFDRMAEKTVLTRALKYIPKTLEISNYLYQDGIIRGEKEFNRIVNEEENDVLNMDGVYDDVTVEGEVVE